MLTKNSLTTAVVSSFLPEVLVHKISCTYEILLEKIPEQSKIFVHKLLKILQR